MSLFNEASFILIPSGVKAGKVYSEKPIDGDGDLTWSRGSDAFRTNASGVLQRVPWNLLQQSEDFTNAVWGKTNVTVSGNTTTAPNGTTTADTLTTTASTGRHLLLYGDHAATTITASIYVKKNTHNFFQIFTGWAGVAYANYDINNGVVGDVGSGTVASITNVGNGWYRCSFTSPAASASTIRWNLVTSLTAVYNESWTANGTESVYIWGAQIVEGTTAQTYLPTTDRLGFPRLDYTYGSCPSALLEPQRTNSIRNSTMQGAVTGSPGTSPSNWTITNAGMTRSIALGTENGLSYIDITYNGTANASIIVLNFESTTSIIASNGQIWTSSFYVKLIDSTQLPVSFGNYIYERTSSGAYVTEGNQSISPTSTLQRFTYTRTLNGGATVGAVYNALGIALTNGNSYNFTIRVYQPQMELGAYATTPIFTTGTSATRIADTFTRNNIYTNGLISASGGTWYVELKNNVAYVRDSANVGLFIGDDTTNTNGFAIRNLSTGRLAIQKFIATVNTNLYNTLTDSVKIAIKWNGTTADVFVNGVKVVSSSVFTTTIMQYLSSSSNTVIPTFIQAMALYNTPLSDSNCVTLTT